MQDGSHWGLHPQGFKFLQNLVEKYSSSMHAVREMEKDLIRKTSTRLFDWIDHVLVPWSWVDESDLDDAGFFKESVRIAGMELVKATNDNSTFFPLFLTDLDIGRLYLKVENIEHIASIHDRMEDIEGQRWAPRRKLIIKTSDNLSLGAIERNGYDGYEIPELDDEPFYSDLLRNFTARKREGLEEDRFSELEEMIEKGVSSIGKNRTADAFFRSERRYWERRNGSGRIQLGRQNSLGLGWGNHDHHTFRCSRKNFRRGIETLEKIGMKPRERFYAGEQAGWGAQVMEHHVCGISVFADVDLTPDEKAGDFAHEDLGSLEDLGTVGLWVGLHGESMLTAGLHHLAARVDFSRMMRDSPSAGIEEMTPFSSFPYLKQCFSFGERWDIDKERARYLQRNGSIDMEQMNRFISKGGLGSHIEFIERNEGFKGFNRSAVSDIIERTDPRK
ncbi:MAG: hypothetical protein ACMUHY_00230 [Thermoplasmatota archaeon]